MKKFLVFPILSIMTLSCSLKSMKITEEVSVPHQTIMVSDVASDIVHFLDKCEKEGMSLEEIEIQISMIESESESVFGPNAKKLLGPQIEAAIKGEC